MNAGDKVTHKVTTETGIGEVLRVRDGVERKKEKDPDDPTKEIIKEVNQPNSWANVKWADDSQTVSRVADLEIVTD